MAQYAWHDFTTPNQNAKNAPLRIGQNFEIQRTLSSGAARPSNPWPYQIHANEAESITTVDFRDKANASWLSGFQLIPTLGLIHYKDVAAVTDPSASPTEWTHRALLSNGSTTYLIPCVESGDAW